MRFIPLRLIRLPSTEMMIRGFLGKTRFPHLREVTKIWVGVLYLESYHLSRMINFFILVKMPHSNFKERSQEFNKGIGKCPCGQTFEYTSERDMKMKLRMHCRFCSNPPKGFDKIGIPKKACTMREQQLNEAERIRKVYNSYLSVWINITIPERNQEVTLYPQELTSTLLIQKLIQAHLRGNTSRDYQCFLWFLSIYN